MPQVWYYFWAVKYQRRLIIKANEAWHESAMGYLMGKEYKLEPASEQHWNRGIDEVGRKCEVYLLDEELTEFDVGTY